METFCMFFAALFTFLWVGFALSPWGLWRNKEVLDVVEGAKDNDVLNQVTILIPARNEGEVIQQTLQSIAQQGPGSRIIVIDDGSDDATVAKAHQAGSVNLRIIPGQPLPPGWGGKL
jgi:cellulose synthase/poly-beta-1,6-N-acetylglucosamine synthase-like glycosyltransferase